MNIPVLNKRQSGRRVPQ